MDALLALVSPVGSLVISPHQLTTSRSRAPAMARIAGHGRQSGSGQRLDLHPKCGLPNSDLLGIKAFAAAILALGRSRTTRPLQG